MMYSGSLIIIITLHSEQGAHSNEVTAYSGEYEVTEECSEVDFCKKNIHGYRTKWSQHGYFQFTEPERIKPNQRIIVKKKVN